MRRWLGDGAEARRAQYGKISNVTVALLYSLAIAGMIIVWLAVLVACKPAEPLDNTPPAERPSQRYVSQSEEPCRCTDRPPLDHMPSEDPRQLP